MTNDIFTKKTPLVLAVGAALGLGVQTAWAADDKPAEPPQHHTIELGDGDGKLDNVIAKDDEVKLPDNFSDEEWKDSDVIDVKGTTGEGAIDSIKISGGTLTIGSKVGAVVFDRETVKNIEISDGSFSNSSTTYLEGASLKATGGTFTNSGTLKIGIDYLEPREGEMILGALIPLPIKTKASRLKSVVRPSSRTRARLSLVTA